MPFGRRNGNAAAADCRYPRIRRIVCTVSDIAVCHILRRAVEPILGISCAARRIGCCLRYGARPAVSAKRHGYAAADGEAAAAVQRFRSGVRGAAVYRRGVHSEYRAARKVYNLKKILNLSVLVS